MTFESKTALLEGDTMNLE